MDKRNAIARWAREERARAGYRSSGAAAAAAGVKESWLRSVEAGKIGRPSQERLARLAELYGSEPPEGSEAGPDEVAGLLAWREGYREGWADAMRSVSSPAASRAQLDAVRESEALERGLPPETPPERRSGSSGRRSSDRRRG